MVQVTAVALLSAAVLPGAMAWGAMGHETVAYIATNFVAASTKTYFQTLLGDTSTDYLASVSTWADSYRVSANGPPLLPKQGGRRINLRQTSSWHMLIMAFVVHHGRQVFLWLPLH